VRAVNTFVLILLALPAALLAGCANTPKVDERFIAALNAPYRLDAGDVVRINVFDQSNLTDSYAVDDSGVISMPLVGAVAARGQTTQDLERLVTAQLANGFLRDPSVSIQVETFRPFFILGEVGAPGQYPYVADLTARSAVAVGGGFSSRAVKNMVRLSRKYNGTIVEANVPIDHPIRPGDTVTVLERWF